MIDTHCHLIDPQFQSDFRAVLERATSAGISAIVNIGYDLKTSIDALRMHDQYPWLFPAVGIHPNEYANRSIHDMQDIEKLLESGAVIAIGETGLDYYRDLSPKEAQKELFRGHINIARRYNLPLIIHTRNSTDDTIKILSEENYHIGVFHCYSGTTEQARAITDLGYYLGFGGLLTFSKKVRETFKHVPIERIVLETDAPFLSPEGHRGKRNEPAFIIETLNTAAALLNIPTQDLESILNKNAHTLFSLGQKT